jgi:hypothetical protein
MCALQATGNLVRVRTLVAQHLAKADEEKTTDWLYACSKGDNNKVRQVRVPCCSLTSPEAGTAGHLMQ